MRIIVDFDTDGTLTASIVGTIEHDANVGKLTIDMHVDQKSLGNTA
jgi:hypothetical protein